ncbi:cyclin-domain-containing protein [Mucor lusitanicus]|uniref:Cyclin-domain-containing protein n=2 Tax=Mucor circinelloides f. lusitanicus TaxID=29924 RepID=A0A8H4BIG7_MUCCL|nr:cyclin-domain-containing protein [Mucor lusitanicus]
MMATANKTFVEKQHQFSDTSCQERSIMIDKLIDCAADIIDSIWTNNRSAKIMSTARFIREILKRSRATYSMLQLALFYIFRIKKLIFERLQQPLTNNELVCCGRRMFLAALMVASKYLNDKNYRNKTWAKIASLDIAEINATEVVFLKLIDYQLYVSKPLYDKWVSLLHDHIQKKSFIVLAKQKQDLNYYYSALNMSRQQQHQHQHQPHTQHQHHLYPYQHLYPHPQPHHPYTSPASSSSYTSSPSTSVTSTPPPPPLHHAAPAPAVMEMHQTPPLAFGRKRSLSIAHYHDNVDDSRMIKHLRHV